MKIWLACFGVLFALAELYQWAQHLTLPLPIYILGGVFLAIASNYNKIWSRREPNTGLEPLIESTNNSYRANVPAQPIQPVSFTVLRSCEPKD